LECTCPAGIYHSTDTHVLTLLAATSASANTSARTSTIRDAIWVAAKEWKDKMKQLKEIKTT
jgi:hypothetical protein